MTYVDEKKENNDFATSSKPQTNGENVPDGARSTSDGSLKFFLKSLVFLLRTVLFLPKYRSKTPVFARFWTNVGLILQIGIPFWLYLFLGTSDLSGQSIVATFLLISSIFLFVQGTIVKICARFFPTAAVLIGLLAFDAAHAFYWLQIGNPFVLLRLAIPAPIFLGVIVSLLIYVPEKSDPSVDI